MCLIIAEDEDIVREIYKKQLTSLGLEVYAFDNGKCALKFFKDNYENINLILSDHVMPELSGIELFIQIRQIEKSIPFLLLTGSALFNECDYFVNNGGILISKPITLSELFETIMKHYTIKKQ